MKKIIWFLTIYFLVAPFANAQVDLQNSGILFSTSSTDTLFINGSFTNTSTAVLTNNGSLYIKQTLINDQSLMST